MEIACSGVQVQLSLIYQRIERNAQILRLIVVCRCAIFVVIPVTARKSFEVVKTHPG